MQRLFQVTNFNPPPDQLAEVARLATVIADRILEQNASGTSIAPEQFRMLVNAARMLHENDAAWPSSLEFVLREVAERADRIASTSVAPPVSTAGEGVVASLMQSLDTFLREKDRRARPEDTQSPH